MNKNTPTTTFARIKAAGPCESSYKRALRKAGGLRKYGEDTPITVRQIVEAVGLDDALWVLRTIPEHNARWRLLAVRYARRVQHLMIDPRSVAALDVTERHAHGSATDAELDAASTAAWNAWAAARAAASATRDAATWVAARVAARDARDAATWAAAWAAWAATWVAGAAASTAAWDAAEAAGDAAWAAWAATWAAGAATWAVGAAAGATWAAAGATAGDAAGDAEREWQAAELIRICDE